MGMTVISGNTYQARKVIKEMGFKWNPSNKTWVKYSDTFNNIDALAGFSGIIINQSKDNGIVKDILDTRSYKQRYGKCEDAPCCGCCGVY